MKTNHKLVKNVLMQLGNSTEAQYYLDQYSNINQPKFAVVKIGGNVIAQELEQLAESLSLITQLGMLPIILHGAGPQIDAAIKKQELPVNKIDGLRVTDEKTIKIIEPVIHDVHQQLLTALKNENINTKSLFNKVFTCDYLDEQKYGYVGKIKQVWNDEINAAIINKQVPVLSCLGHDDNGKVMNINADIAMRKLVWKTNPAKVIFVTPTGGLLDEKERIIPAIQLSNEYDHLMQQPWLHSGMKLKIQQIYQLLKPMPRKLSVSITSANQLGKELFTHKGHGTFVSMGESINHHQVVGSSIKLKLISLLQSTFGKKLKNDFFDTLDVMSVFVSDSGQALALVTKGEEGKPYLNKFAVTTQAQGQGLGKAIWEKMLDYYPVIYWRSRSNNKINPWYYNQADCSYKDKGWVVFSCGMPLSEAISCMQAGAQYADSWQQAS
ncbi:MAG: acetylglutamate kinase [Marinicellaceae bacterium]